MDAPPAPAPAPAAPARTGPPGLTFPQSIALFFGLLLLMAVPPAAVIGTAKWLGTGDNGEYRAEIVLPAVLLVGVISLMAVLTIVVLVFSRLELTSKDGALGLPDGTIQAVIALALILIFAIVGVYLHGVAGDVEVRTLSGLTRAQVDALPATELVSVRGTGGGEWEAVIEPHNEEQDDLAKQLLTTVSTLVVAVAGFYFGAKSVREATREGAAAALGGAATASAPPDQPGPGGTDEDEEVDETGAYGERSPVTGLGQSDIEDEVDGGGETAEAEDDEPEEEAAATMAEAEGAAEPALEDHPDYQDEPDFYPDEDDEATDADEDSPPAPAEGDDDRA